MPPRTKPVPELSDEDLEALAALPANLLEELAGLSAGDREALEQLAAEAAAAPAPDQPELSDEDLEAEELVRCRWLSVDPVLVHDPTTAVVTYGTEVWLTAEQADDPNTPAARWDDDWEPDAGLVAQARLAAGIYPDDQED